MGHYFLDIQHISPTTSHTNSEKATIAIPQKKPFVIHYIYLYFTQVTTAEGVEEFFGKEILQNLRCDFSETRSLQVFLHAN